MSDLCQVGKVYILSTSSGILGLYNLWRRPFYGLKEDLGYYGMKKTEDSLKCPMFSWFCKISINFLSKIIQRLLLC
jgi:hypothetical protein